MLMMFVRRGLTPITLLWTNVLRDDGWSEQLKPVVVSNKTNIQDLYNRAGGIIERNTQTNIQEVTTAGCHVK